ncbi:hypothetical protein AGMMS49928_02210 [Spirochaetia bacterium]|nr:hypothetical protein AGMMS49928_02210 [Spirochaetia bacterium]
MSFLPNFRRRAATPLMIGGHRGHKSGVRENTIPNYRLIADSGISHIEIDVQMSADGEAVIYHDFELSEASPLQGMVRQYSLSELKNAFEIDTLEESLAWCSSAGMPAALELKTQLCSMYTDMEKLTQSIAGLLDYYRFYDMCFVFGLDYHSLYEIKRLAPKTNLGLIVPMVPRDPVKLMEDMEAQVYLCYIENLCPPLVEQLHRRGFTVDGSVINTRSRLEDALALGVDIIESDLPLEMLELYKEITIT